MRHDIGLVATTLFISGCAADLFYRKLGDTWASGVGYNDCELERTNTKSVISAE